MSTLYIKHLPLQDYRDTLQAMQVFTHARTIDTPDEVWTVQHPSVFTQGQAGKAEHILDPGDIPIVQSDRGGQITYHGPGQAVIYLLLDLRRLGIGIRSLVCTLEKAVIAYLAECGISGSTRSKAPGVYVGDAKICSLGLRVKKGCTYHGLALNHAMDLSPFQRINPCGTAGLPVTQIKNCTNLAAPPDLNTVNIGLITHLIDKLGYTAQQTLD